MLVRKASAMKKAFCFPAWLKLLVSGCTFDKAHIQIAGPKPLNRDSLQVSDQLPSQVFNSLCVVAVLSRLF